MFDIVAPDEAELAVGVNGGGLDHGQALFTSFSCRVRISPPEDGLERPNRKHKQGDDKKRSAAMPRMAVLRSKSMANAPYASHTLPHISRSAAC